MKMWLFGMYFDPAENISTDMTYRFRFAKILQWVGGPFLYAYSVYFFVKGFYFAAAMILAAGLTITIGSLWIFRSNTQEKSLLVYRVMVALFFFFMVLHHTNLIGMNHRIDYVGWLFIYPLLAFFSLGNRGGIIWGLISLLSVLISFLIQEPLSLTPTLLLNLKIQTLVALSGIGLIAYIYENVRHLTQEGLIQKHQALLESEKRLKESNGQLTQEISERKAAEEALNKMRNELELRVKARTSELTREIGERKQAEAALLESEERYKALFERSLDCVYVHDFQGNFIDANPASLNLFGIRKEEVRSFNFQSILDEGQLLLAFQTLQELIENGFQKKMTEFKITNQKDEMLYLETIASTIYRHGEPYAVQGIARDITSRKKVEEALYREKENFRKLVEESPFGVSLIGEDGNFKYVNPEFSSMFGYGLEDLQRNPNHDGVSIDVKDLKGLISEGTPVMTIPVVCKDGSEKLVDSRPVRLESGEKIIFYEDISEKKSLEMRLRHAQKMEAIGTLAGGVAHDLNNILSGILSYPDLLLMDLPQDSPLRDPLLTIKKSGEKAATIVQDLLTLARRGVMAKEVTNFNEIISEYLKSPEHESLSQYHRNLRFLTRPDEHLLNILGSPVHLSKVIMNLVSNAAEAMAAGGEVLISTQNLYVDRIRTENDHLGEGEYVAVRVIDQGIGMTEKEVERIFEPFYTTKVMGRSGTGLGMSVVWGTVEDHNGFIDIKSEIGKGTTFTLYFPATRKDADGNTQPITAGLSAGRGEMVLVVDDVEDQRKIAEEMLRKIGYRTASVSNGKEAVEYVTGNPVDLLILDMIMEPNMDGLETYRRVIQMRPGQRAVITSGFSETDRVKEAQRLGAGRYLKKPYTLEAIAVAVREELDR